MPVLNGDCGGRTVESSTAVSRLVLHCFLRTEEMRAVSYPAPTPASVTGGRSLRFPSTPSTPPGVSATP